MSLFLFLLLLLSPVVCSHHLLLLCCCRRRSSSSTCHRPPFLVAITVYCCIALLRIVSHCCSFPSDVQPFVHYSIILVSVLIKIWPHLDATTGEYCCVRVGRHENDVPLWSTAQEEKKGRGYIGTIYLFLFVLATSLFCGDFVDGMHASARPDLYGVRSVINATLPLR